MSGAVSLGGPGRVAPAGGCSGRGGASRCPPAGGTESGRARSGPTGEGLMDEHRKLTIAPGGGAGVRPAGEEVR